MSKKLTMNDQYKLAKTQERLNILDASRHWPILDNLDFQFVHIKTLFTYLTCLSGFSE